MSRISAFCRYVTLSWICLLLSCVASPQATPPPEGAVPNPQEALPADDAIPGWRQVDTTTTYDSETLFDFMNGAADLYFTYGFERLAVGKYQNADGVELQVEVYGVATDADAYGLFTYNSYGEPIDLGIDGELESGTRLAFWQRRTFVQVIAREPVDDETLRAFGQAVHSALPEGGERPEIVQALPTGGMQPGSARFFRQKMALDNLIWLGSKDVLGLGEDVEGVLAHYQIDGQEADLILVAFPDDQRAQDALSGLQGAGIEELVAAEIKSGTLGAVLGQVDESVARELLDEALSTPP